MLLIAGALWAGLAGPGVANANGEPSWPAAAGACEGSSAPAEAEEVLHALPTGFLVRALVGEAGGEDAPETATSPCPDDMIWVEGDYCTEVKQHCRVWLDDPALPYARCAEYENPVECVGPRVPLSFCIDRFEYTRPGEDAPLNHMSFDAGSKLCRTLGKRICTESEWNFACEGEEMRPYPYGFIREAKCNQDRSDLFEMAVVDGKRRQVLKDNREPSDPESECVSPFGVHDMVGNLDEPVLREATRYSPPFRNALKGGWWMAARNRCRPATTAHDDFYEGTQVGVRCCADVPGDAEPTG